MRLTCISAVLLAASLSAQVAQKANENYQTENGRATLAKGLTAPDRDARQKPQELVAALGLKPGMTVADLGTGPGYLLPHLSRAVGPSGKVIAEDVFPDYLAMAKKNAAALKNVDFVLGDEKSVKLPAGAVDVALLLDVYHHLNYPQTVLSSIATGLKTGGRLVVIEYHKNKESMPGGRALEHVRLGEEDAIREIQAAGWKLVTRKDFIPRVQWMGVFEKK